LGSNGSSAGCNDRCGNGHGGGSGHGSGDGGGLSWAHAVSGEHALKHRIVAGGAIDLEVGASLAGLIEGLEAIKLS